MSDFYSTVSHELRTPLTSIRTALGLLEGSASGNLSGKGSQLTRIARSECDRLIRLINDILDIRRIESGKLSLKLQTIDSETLVEVTLNALSSLAKEAGVTLITDVRSGRLQCDIDRIVQVLTNLVSNAIRFSPRSGIVTVNGEHCGDGYKFSVVDQGPGIPADQMHKLWNRFQQLDSKDGQSKGGSGLGLAITKAIVVEHGGTVGVESAVGHGASFWFEIPERVAETVSHSLSDLPMENRRVLLVDDDDDVLDLLKGLLASSGYELVRAGRSPKLLSRSGAQTERRSIGYTAA